MHIFIVSIIFGGLFCAIELLRRFTDISTEYTRKIMHIISGIIIAFLPFYMTRDEIVVLTLLFTVFLIFSRKLNFFHSIHRVERHTWGEVYFPIGIGLSAWIFLPQDIELFQFGVLVLGISDGVAAIAGQMMGRNPIWIGKNKKSWQGSIAFFIATIFLFLGFISGYETAQLAGVLVASLLLTVSELVLVYGFDNLVLPLLAPVLLAVILGM